MDNLKKLKDYIRNVKDKDVSANILKVLMKQILDQQPIAEDEYIREYDMDPDDKSPDDNQSITPPVIDNLKENLKKNEEEIHNILVEKGKQLTEQKYLNKLQTQRLTAKNKLIEQISQCDQARSNTNTQETRAKYCDGIKTTQDEIAKYTSQLPSRYEVYS